MNHCLVRQDFDSEAFGLPFFRLARLDPELLGGEMRRIARLPGALADARLPAAAIAGAALLQRHGFRKVATQVELARPPAPGPAAPALPGLDLPPAEIARHAANFVHDRFALDVAIPRAAHDRFWARRIANSLSGARHRVVAREGGFVTFARDGDDIRIDLVSVVAKRRGIASELLARLVSIAAREGRRAVRVVTECENAPALALYARAGFSPVRYESVLHFATRVPSDA
jgi:GNAT superfamily N-acetyltransferase